ncbi:MAG: glycosyltransferase [Thiotrichales bacterium]|nr:glycosyltransferase [Thiotrichales bacterium]
MKITQLMLAKGFGGAERYYVDLSRALADAGHQVQAVCHRRFSGRAQLENCPGIQLDAFPVLGWWDLLAQHRMAAVIRRFNPDVMHAHLARAAYLGGRIRNQLQVPLAVKTHNYVDLKYYRNIDLFLPTTRDQGRYLQDHGIARDSIEVLPNFSALPAVAGIEPFTDQAPPRIFGALGRMVRKKGFDILLRAFAGFLEQGGDGELHIGGDGPDKPLLTETIRRLDLKDRVHLYGWVDDVAAFLSGIDVFVLPSLDEPFGIVILEAMARGKPIISTRTQGPSEILSPATAVLAETGNVQAIRDAMLEIQHDPQGASDRAEAALRLFRQHYAGDRVVPALIELYRRMARPLS